MVKNDVCVVRFRDVRFFGKFAYRGFCGGLCFFTRVVRCATQFIFVKPQEYILFSLSLVWVFLLFYYYFILFN